MALFLLISKMVLPVAGAGLKMHGKVKKDDLLAPFLPDHLEIDLFCMPYLQGKFGF